MTSDDDGDDDVLRLSYFHRIPAVHYTADYIWPGLIVTRSRLAQLKDAKFKSDDIIIASYPKTGTTWVSEIVSALVYGLDSRILKEVRLDIRVQWLELDTNDRFVNLFATFMKRLHPRRYFLPNETQFIRRIFFTHLPVELLPSEILLGVGKLIYVHRNAKDTAVSFYHFHRMARFLGQQDLTWDQFIKIFAGGFVYSGSWWEHVDGYLRLSKIFDEVQYAGKMLMVGYEDLHQKPVEMIKRISDFIGCKELSLDDLSGIAKHCSFDVMKNNDAANREGIYLFNDKRSKFMRKGLVNDWKNYFTPEQSQLLDQFHEKVSLYGDYKLL